LRRSLAEIAEQTSDLSTATAHYRPLFGRGDDNSQIVRGVARFGELTVDPGGHSKTVSYANEEQVFFILTGAGVLHYGEENVPVKPNDFMYLPVGIEHGISNRAEIPCRLIVMGFKIPSSREVAATPRLMVANTDDVEWTATHGPGSRFKLLMGNTESKRDKLAASHVLNSLFIMEFQPGIDNKPHHHDREEEIYFILQGEGEILTGEGPDGLGGRYPAKAGDAFFFRLNATVGFSRGPGDENPRILAARSSYPF
jgi:mannose-6-phosphate isomerase-like protein (cupin superfamily)